MRSCKGRVVRDLALVLATTDPLCTGPHLRHERIGGRKQFVGFPWAVFFLTLDRWHTILFLPAGTWWSRWFLSLEGALLRRRPLFLYPVSKSADKNRNAHPSSCVSCWMGVL